MIGWLIRLIELLELIGQQSQTRPSDEQTGIPTSKLMRWSLWSINANPTELAKPCIGAAARESIPKVQVSRGGVSYPYPKRFGPPTGILKEGNSQSFLNQLSAMPRQASCRNRARATKPHVHSGTSSDEWIRNTRSIFRIQDSALVPETLRTLLSHFFLIASAFLVSLSLLSLRALVDFPRWPAAEMAKSPERFW